MCYTSPDFSKYRHEGSGVMCVTQIFLLLPMLCFVYFQGLLICSFQTYSNNTFGRCCFFIVGCVRMVYFSVYRLFIKKGKIKKYK